ncbi:MAG TPA: peptidoglycan editing factor PgeF [Meiothermus sp.]|nr:peptidoglycan editing factor PgeF [Meiothermus sp.]
MITSPLLESPHGFTTREGGVSSGPFASLNLSWATGDDPQKVAENQRRVLEAFGHPPVAALDQIHSNVVHVVSGPGTWEGDGLLTNTPGLLLRVGVADCYPVLLEDPTIGAVGALHAGWRGVITGILPNALERMHEHYGSRMGDVRVAIGPGICGQHFQVGPEVVERFESAEVWAQVAQTSDPGTPTPIYWPDPTTPGRYRLDLLEALKIQATRAGILPHNLWALGACTSADPRFFSHRRDQGKTGRMWGVIQAKR